VLLFHLCKFLQIVLEYKFLIIHLIKLNLFLNTFKSAIFISCISSKYAILFVNSAKFFWNINLINYSRFLLTVRPSGRYIPFPVSAPFFLQIPSNGSVI
jgi:hypothetical protein